MYAPTCLYLHCAAVLFAAVTAQQNFSFWNENEFCQNLNSKLVDQTFIGNANASISCNKVKNEQSKRDNISILNDVRFLCREFDSLTYVWNNIKNTTDDVIIIVEFMSYDTSDLHTIIKTNSSYIQINNLKPNTKYVARFRVSINGVINYYTTSDTPIAMTLTINTKPDAVVKLKISDFHLTTLLLKTILTWKPSKSMNCHYRILYYPNRIEMPRVFNVIVNESFSFVLNGLTTDSLYTVTVQSYYNKTSPNIKSEKAELKFTTPSCWKVDGYDINSCPPGQPENVTVTETKTLIENVYNVTISWTNPNPNGVNYFLVKMDEHKKNVPGTMNNAHFDNVLLKDQYFVGVQAFSRAGHSTENIKWRKPRIKYVQDVVAVTDYKYTNNYYAWTIALAALAFCGTLAVVKYVHQRMATDYGNGTMVDPAAYDMDLIKGMDKVEIILNHKNVIVTDVFLGHGYFGVVKKGMVKTDDKTQYPVAIKSLRDNPSSREWEEFLSEILLMQKVGKHPNIVSMIGCCLDTNKRWMLIVEYCPLGDLQTYLRKVNIKSWYTNEFYVDQSIELIAAANSFQVESMESGNPLPMVSNNCYMYHGKEKVFLTVDDLMRFASQTANGMVFLEKNRIVHRDLAARNVLLSDHHTIKICDFGLSRDIYEQNLYQKSNRGGPLPVKWMAMESLKFRVYTTQSDVWSFGVLLWEIMTLGACPYPTISSSRIYEMLCRGYRMPRPTLCCYSLYEVMLECWHSKPANRPKFKTIKDTIDRIMENQYS